MKANAVSRPSIPLAPLALATAFAFSLTLVVGLVGAPAAARAAAPPTTLGKPGPIPHGTKSAAPAPATPAHEAPTPRPGSIVHSALPGGWLLEVAGDPDHLLVDVPGFSPKTGRTLLVVAASSQSYETLADSTATILGPDARTVRTESLRGYHAITGDLSPDGTLAGIIAEPWEEGGNRAVLIGFTAAGKIWKRPATQGDDVIALGNGMLAEIAQPVPPAAIDDLENNPPSPAAPTTKVEPVRFFDATGAPVRPPAPISGAVARAGDGLVSVDGRTLTVYSASLHAHGHADLPFENGFPAVAANGALIAVADFSEDASKKEKDVLLFDAAAKKVGTITMPASVGISAAISPDGTAVLATPATLGVNGPARTIEETPGIAVELTDRTGKVRWRYVTERRTEMEHAGSLSVAAGGKRAACGFFASDPDSHPDRAVVFDEDGKVLYQAEGSFRAVWLDPAGEWLYTMEDEGLSRLRVKDLVAGTAFPR